MPLEHNVAGAWRACFCTGTAAIVVVQLPPPLRLTAETALLLACAPTLAASSDRAVASQRRVAPRCAGVRARTALYENSSPAFDTVGPRARPFATRIFSMQGIAHPAIPRRCPHSAGPTITGVLPLMTGDVESCSGVDAAPADALTERHIRPQAETHAETEICTRPRRTPGSSLSVHTPHVRPVAVHAGLKLGQRL